MQVLLSAFTVARYFKIPVIREYYFSSFHCHWYIHNINVEINAIVWKTLLKSCFKRWVTLQQLEFHERHFVIIGPAPDAAGSTILIHVCGMIFVATASVACEGSRGKQSTSAFDEILNFDTVLKLATENYIETNWDLEEMDFFVNKKIINVPIIIVYWKLSMFYILKRN